MGWLELGLQIATMALLAGAMPLVFRLERALTAARRDRAALEESATGITEATRLAEAAAIRLRAAAEGAGRQVAERLAAAEPVRDDLRYLAERAEGLADRLDGLIRAARPLSPAEALATEPAPPTAAEAPGASRAERDLLRALTLGLGVGRS